MSWGFLEMQMASGVVNGFTAPDALIAAAMSDSSEPAGMASSTRPTSARMGSAAPTAGS